MAPKNDCPFCYDRPACTCRMECCGRQPQDCDCDLSDDGETFQAAVDLLDDLRASDEA